VHNGPPHVARALNIGIELLLEHRGHGYGTTAQRMIAEHLFSTSTIERLEASTDVDNLAEQRALTKAGFTREGRLRHAWFRAGAWRDTVLYSRLRDDPAPEDGPPTGPAA
jgi:RimJ/RimL family protein N-acetyltransferase